MILTHFMNIANCTFNQTINSFFAPDQDYSLLTLTKRSFKFLDSTIPMFDKDSRVLVKRARIRLIGFPEIRDTPTHPSRFPLISWGSSDSIVALKTNVFFYNEWMDINKFLEPSLISNSQICACSVQTMDYSVDGRGRLQIFNVSDVKILYEIDVEGVTV